MTFCKNGLIFCFWLTSIVSSPAALAFNFNQYQPICAFSETESVGNGQTMRIYSRVQKVQEGTFKGCWGGLSGRGKNGVMGLQVRNTQCQVCVPPPQESGDLSVCPSPLLESLKEGEIGLVHTFQFPLKTPSRIYHFEEVGLEILGRPLEKPKAIPSCSNKDEYLSVQVKSASEPGAVLVDKVWFEFTGDLGKVRRGEVFHMRVRMKTNVKILKGEMAYTLEQGLGEEAKIFSGKSPLVPEQLPGAIVHGVFQEQVTQGDLELKVNLTIPETYLQAKVFRVTSLLVQDLNYNEILIPVPQELRVVILNSSSDF